MQTCHLYLAFRSPWGKVRITVHCIALHRIALHCIASVILPEPGKIAMLGQLTPREVLGNDVLHQQKARLEGDGLQDRLGEMMEDTPNPVATPTSVRTTVKAFRALGQSSELDDVYEVTEDLITQASAVFTVPIEEKEARRDALYKAAVLDAGEHGA